MKQYTVIKKSDMFSWESVEPMKVSEVLWLPDAEIRMEQKMCYDENALYVYQLAYEKKIRSEENGPLSAVCHDSCMEFFFRPGNDERYLNFEVNPNCILNCGLGIERKNRITLVKRDYTDFFQMESRRKKGMWEIFFQIPVSFLQLIYPAIELKPGLILYGNCYKCGDMTEVKHYLSWSRVMSEKPDFHRPQDFGRLVLV